MELIISLDVNNISITLRDIRKIVGQLSWTDEYTLSEKLLPNIDKLLIDNKIDKSQVTKAIGKITKKSGVTSSRIVLTIVKAWNAAQKLDK